jgi:hypothetical protein
MCKKTLEDFTEQYEIAKYISSSRDKLSYYQVAGGDLETREAIAKDIGAFNRGYKRFIHELAKRYKEPTAYDRMSYLGKDKSNDCGIHEVQKESY